MTHELKTVAPHFDNVKNGSKHFEIRKLDRDFKVDDFLVLQEYEPIIGYSGRSVTVVVTHILKDAFSYGLRRGYCIMSIWTCSIQPKYFPHE